VINLKNELEIRLKDPRIFLNEFFGYLSFFSGLLTTAAVLFDWEIYETLNLILLSSCGLQNIPLLMVYIPQFRVLISTGILGIVVLNFFATHPIGNAFREGLFVGMIKIDYSYEALVKYHPDKYPYEKNFLGQGKFFKNISEYLWINLNELFIRSQEIFIELQKANFKVFINDPIRSQYFSSLIRILTASPLFLIAFLELLSIMGLYEKTIFYEDLVTFWSDISMRALAFASFMDGLSKIAFGFMRECFMMKVGGVIFAFAQFLLIFLGIKALIFLIPLSLAGLAAYPIAESERLRNLVLSK
jgi:hypothetical protein